MKPLELPLLMYKETGSVRKGTKKSSWVVPSWNHLYVIRNNAPILDQWAKAHKNKIMAATTAWADENKWEMTEDRKVFVRVRVFWNDARQKDCHNLDKLVMDAFEGIIFDNDSNGLLQFVDFTIDIENPRIEVEFEAGEFIDRKKIAEEQRKKADTKNKK